MAIGLKENKSRNAELRVAPRSAVWPPPWMSEADPSPLACGEELAKSPAPETASEKSDVPAIPHPWRRPLALARAPIARRQEWADRCDELERAGVPWPEHEHQAFVELFPGALLEPPES